MGHINLNSPAIIFSNIDLSQSIMDTLIVQLRLTYIINAADFDNNVAIDGYYISDIYQLNLRVLVLRDLQDQTNRNIADIVLFFKNGLASVLCRKVAQPGKTYTINNIYLNQLFQCAPCCPTECCYESIYGRFVGMPSCFSFEWPLPSPRVWPPNKPLPCSSF